MQIITYNTSKSKIERDEDSRAIRIAYLLGDKVAMAGDIVLDYEYVDKAVAESPFRHKIMVLEEIFKLGHYDKTFIDLDATRLQIKKFETTKNKTVQQIVAFNKLKLYVKDIFKDHIDGYKKALISFGFTELRKLIDEEIIEVFVTSLSEEEKTKKNRAKASSIMGLDFGTKTETKIFLLGNHFFKAPFMDEATIVDAQHESATNENTVYIKPLFKIPNIVQLKAPELKLIRNSIDKVKQSFCAEAGKWADMCYNKENFEERKETLLTQVLPAAKELDVALNSHPNIRHAAGFTKIDDSIEVFIGEIPYQLLLHYNLHYNVIEEKTLVQMKILQEQDLRLNGRWPVIFYRSVYFENIFAPFKTDVDESELSTKKSIALE